MALAWRARKDSRAAVIWRRRGWERARRRRQAPLSAAMGPRDACGKRGGGAAERPSGSMARKKRSAAMLAAAHAAGQESHRGRSRRRCVRRARAPTERRDDGSTVSNLTASSDSRKPRSEVDDSSHAPLPTIAADRIAPTP
jgi:hypothetical protein